MNAPLSPAEIARETLIQLASRRMAPTPENFRTVYQSITGRPDDGQDQPLDLKLAESVKSLADANGGQAARKAVEQALARRDWQSSRSAILALANITGATARTAGSSQSWPRLLKELIGGFDHGNAAWTKARKRSALDSLMSGTANSDTLLSRLEALVAAWKESEPSKPLQMGEQTDAIQLVSDDDVTDVVGPAPEQPCITGTLPASVDLLRECLATTLETTLPGLLRHMPDLAWEAHTLATRARQASSPALLEKFGGDLREFTRRIELQGGDDGRMREALLGLLRLLIDNVEQLVEGDHWIQGQVAIVKAVLSRPLTPEVIDQAEQAIKDLMAKQSALKRGVEEARASLKSLLQNFIERLGEMSDFTGTYQEKLGSYSDKLEHTQDLDSINEIIRELVRDTRAMKDNAEQSRSALASAREHVKHAELRIQQMEHDLEQMTARVRQDPLTGVLNRGGLDEAFKSEAGRADRQNSAMSVALLDIDNFKALNDSLGHQAGDEALQYIVGIIKEHLRSSDQLARYGGEEFVVLLPDSDIATATEVLTRLQRELTKRFFLHGNKRLLVTFSCGLTERQPGEELDLPIVRADRALYQAKRAGKNRVVVAEEDAGPVAAARG